MKKKILVIEKNEEILQIITYLLLEEGYEVNSSKTEAGIFDVIMNYKPDAVLLDIIRPTPEGTELCRAIKESDKTCHIPVIVLSTHSKIETLKEICADEVVKKPFDITHLTDVLQKHLVA